MSLQGDFLGNSDVGESIDDVESLLKKHGTMLIKIDAILQFLCVHYSCTLGRVIKVDIVLFTHVLLRP
jgi:hypothetical protein